MVAKKRTKLADARKPTHSLDAARPSKGAKGGRDASTVSLFLEFFGNAFFLTARPFVKRETQLQGSRTTRSLCWM